MTSNVNAFDEEYFETGVRSNYRGYVWKPRLIGPRIHAITNAAGVSPPARVLDYGCAKGFYVRWLRLHGFDAWGIDISHYAIHSAPEDVADYLSLYVEGQLPTFPDDHFQLTIVKDVLEHMKDQASLLETLAVLRRISCQVFVTVPFCKCDRVYVNEDDEKDTTHAIRLTLEEWHKLLGGEQDWALCKRVKGHNYGGTYCTIIRR